LAEWPPRNVSAAPLIERRARHRRLHPRPPRPSAARLEPRPRRAHRRRGLRFNAEATCQAGRRLDLRPKFISSAFHHEHRPIDRFRCSPGSSAIFRNCIFNGADTALHAPPSRPPALPPRLRPSAPLSAPQRPSTRPDALHFRRVVPLQRGPITPPANKLIWSRPSRPSQPLFVHLLLLAPHPTLHAH
jgi:hypothetical protein